MTDTIMLKLKESTKPLHDSAEQNQFQKRLAHGDLERDRYISYLEQLLLIHSHLADLLGKHRAASARIGTIVKDRHLSTKALEDDLGSLDMNPEKAKALTATNKFLLSLTKAEESCPNSLLGALYVLEGSTHGAKYMASSLRKGLGLSERSGSSYFDRYQDEQMSYWLEFKKDMNKEPISEREEKATIDMARATFEAFIEIGTEILKDSE